MIELEPTTSPQALADLVRGITLRCRTGLLLLDEPSLGREPQLAARLKLEFADFQRFQLARLRGARFLGLTAEALLEDLEALVVAPHVHEALLIANFDLPLAYLDSAARDHVWSYLFEGFSKRSHGALFAMPRTAERLLPELSILESWAGEGRVAVG
jgi:hypothetical protein